MCLGGRVFKSSNVVVQEASLFLRLSSFTRVFIVAEATKTDFTVSPENIAIHATTESERRSTIKYFPLRKILHRVKERPMVV